MKRKLLIVLATLMFFVPAQAQESTEDTTEAPTAVVTETPTQEPPIVVDPPVTVDPSPVQGELEAALAALVLFISNVTFVPIAAPFVVAVLALLKPLLPEKTNMGLVALVVQVIVWVVYILAKNAGLEPQFNNLITAATTIVGALGGIVISAITSQWIYDKAKNNHVPLVGTTQAQIKAQG